MWSDSWLEVAGDKEKKKRRVRQVIAGELIIIGTGVAE